MVVELIVGLIILAGAYVWVKKKFLQPEVSENVDISSVRGVPLVKKAQNPAAVAEPESESAVEPDVLPVEAKVESVEPVKISDVEVVIEPSPEPVSVSQSIPEDSVLKRHYWAQVEAERLNLSNPYPSDSVLRRHYESAMLSQLTESMKVAASIEVEASINVPTQSIEAFIPTQIMPEDSVLKRHYAQLIQSHSAAN